MAQTRKAVDRNRPRANAPEKPTGPARRSGPVIRVMRRAACEALLRRHVVGRIAFSFHDRVDIVPIHYVLQEGWLFARTSRGAKLTTMRHSPWVAFEVDEVDGIFDWRSVVVHGTVYEIAPDAAGTGGALWTRGVAALRKLIPKTGTEADPVPFRSVVFGIHIDTMTGRSSSSRKHPSPRSKRG